MWTLRSESGLGREVLRGVSGLEYIAECDLQVCSHGQQADIRQVGRA